MSPPDSRPPLTAAAATTLAATRADWVEHVTQQRPAALRITSGGARLSVSQYPDDGGYAAGQWHWLVQTPSATASGIVATEAQARHCCEQAFERVADLSAYARTLAA